MSEVTPIRPGIDVTPPPAPPSFLAIAHANLREQLTKMGEAMGIVRVSAAAIREVCDCDSADGVPIDSALRGACRILEDVFGEFVKLESDAEAELEAAQS
jgi:hypothetical protein